MSYPRAILTCALLAVSMLSGCGDERDTPRPRNVVLIVADTLRADRLGCYGYYRNTTPMIDGLAAEGVLYENCHAQSCWTLPSMISLMSGLPVTRKERQLPPVPLLAEKLKAEGFSTAAFIANLAIHKDQGFDRGFDCYIPAASLRWGDRAPQVADEFAAWLRSWLDNRKESEDPKDSRQGFFAWIQFIDPHEPYEPSFKYDVFKGSRADLERLLPLWQEGDAKAAELSPVPPAIKLKRAVQLMVKENNRYDGEVKAVDEGVKRILDALRGTGEYADTLIIFCSDHGEQLYEHEHFPLKIQKRIENKGGLHQGVKDLFCYGHRALFYEEIWKTPLIIKGPGWPKGVRLEGLAANLDIYPTILDALGLKKPEGLRGESLLGGRVPERDLVFGYGFDSYAVLSRDGKKLVQNHPKYYPDEDQDRPHFSFYDLQADGDESRNLSGEKPEETRGLSEAVRIWCEQNARPAIEELSPEALEALKMLGYTDTALRSP